MVSRLGDRHAGLHVRSHLHRHPADPALESRRRTAFATRAPIERLDLGARRTGRSRGTRVARRAARYGSPGMGPARRRRSCRLRWCRRVGGPCIETGVGSGRTIDQRRRCVVGRRDHPHHCRRLVLELWRHRDGVSRSDGDRLLDCTGNTLETIGRLIATASGLSTTRGALCDPDARSSSMYQRCINPRCTGLCRPVRVVSARPPIIPARWHNLTRSGTSRNSPRSPFFGFASRGSWVRFPSSPPNVNRRDVRRHGERHAVTRAVGALDRAGDHSRSSRRVSPLRNASTTSRERSRARSLVIARLTWVFTVNGDR